MRNRRVVCSRALALVLPVTLGFGCGLKRDWSICAPADKQPCLTGYVCTDDLRCVRAGDGGSDALVRVDSHGVSDVAGGGERDWSVCSPPAEMCLPGFACTADFRCVLVAGGGSDGPANVDNRGPTDADAGPASTSTDGPTGISSGLDGPERDGAPAVVPPDALVGAAPDAPPLDGPERDGAPAVVSPDALVGTAPDAPPEAPLPDAPPASLPDARVPDAPPVDAPGTCSTDQDCSPQSPLCLNNRCAKCAGDSDCNGRTGPTCAPSGLCVACTASSQCTDPTKPICQGNVCVACAAGAATACGAKDSSKPTCDTGTGKCVECTTSNQCTTPGKPICGNAQTCVACGDTSAPTNGCSARNASLAACNLTSGICVECTANLHCTSSGKPVCNTSTNQCVQCVDSSQCGGATPICSSNTCVACTTDAQCMAKLGQNPGVCMFHQDGRCATDAETIYAEYLTPGCSNTIGSGGTATTPYCDTQTAISALAATKRLIVVRGTVGGFSYDTPGLQLTVVGQLDGDLYPAGVIPNCVEISNGADLYMRDLICNTNYNAAAVAAHSATLHLLRMVLFDSGGGIILDGSNFEIVDTILSGNNAGEFGTSSFGGIYVNNPPAAGLKRLERVTFKDNNMPTDITCTAPITGVGVYAPDNRIDATCGITPCAPASANCGSSLTWVSPG